MLSIQKIRKTSTKLLAIVLTLVMMLGIVPLGALATAEEPISAPEELTGAIVPSSDTIARENAAVAFTYLFTQSSPEVWVGFNNAAANTSVEFDITQHQYVTHRLPAWPSGGTGVLHGTHRDLYIARPTSANANRLPVVIESITINGAPFTGTLPNLSTSAPARWLVASTIGTINPVTTVGANANAAANANAFAAAGLELRTFQLGAGAFTIPTGAIVEIT